MYPAVTYHQPQTQEHLPQIYPERIAELTMSFLNDRDVKDSSKGLYQRVIRQYFEWVERKGYDLSEITRAEIIEYKKDLLADGKSPHTVGSYLTSVRTFYEWAEAHKLYPNVARGVKTPKKEDKFKRQALIDDQPQKVLDFYTDKRDNAIITLMLMVGLRTIEVVRANVEDVQMKGGQRVLLVHGKGRDSKSEFNIIEPGVWAVIKEYLDTRPNAKPHEPLFVSRSNNSRGKRLTTMTISQLAKKALKGTGLDDRSYTAHSLRHTVGTTIFENGGSMEQVQFTLRHANMNTSQTYAKHAKERWRLKNSGEALMASLYKPQAVNGATADDPHTTPRKVQALVNDFKTLSEEERELFINAINETVCTHTPN